MNNNKKILLIVTIIISFFVQYKFLNVLKLNIDFLTNLVTFLSIVFGFYITSFSIFSTSTFVNSLYNIEDENNKTQTLLHSLIKQYKTGLVANFTSILYCLLLIFIIGQKELSFLYLDNYLTYFLPLMFLFNFFYGFKMISSLVKIITQESKLK